MKKLSVMQMENLQGGLLPGGSVGSGAEEGSLICRLLKIVVTSEMTPIAVLNAVQGYYITNCQGPGY